MSINEPDDSLYLYCVFVAEIGNETKGTMYYSILKTLFSRFGSIKPEYTFNNRTTEKANDAPITRFQVDTDTHTLPN